MYRLLLLSLLFILPMAECSAGLGLRGMRVVDSNLVPFKSPPEHFRLGLEAFHAQDWELACLHFKIISHNFPRSRLAPECYFREGICRLWLREEETANELLSKYLKSQGTPKYFLQAVWGKFCVAERFRQGVRRRLFNTRCMPAWLGGELMAVEIYDEIIAMVPCDDLAAKALFSKGMLLWEIGQMKEGIHSLQTLIRQFPKHELAAESYLQIAQIYQRQSELEFQNPDLLELAKINVRRFQIDFPKEERLSSAKSLLWQTEEIHARGLYETGRLYERKTEFNAACVYYRNAIHRYPNTKVAADCEKRLSYLTGLDEVEITACLTEE